MDGESKLGRPNQKLQTIRKKRMGSLTTYDQNYNIAWGFDSLHRY